MLEVQCEVLTVTDNFRGPCPPLLLVHCFKKSEQTIFRVHMIPSVKNLYGDKKRMRKDLVAAHRFNDHGITVFDWVVIDKLAKTNL